MNRIRITRAAVAIAAFAVSLAVYVKTLAPTVGLVDSGELTAAAALAGNAHPPGFPLYLMALRGVIGLVPAGSVAWRANFGTALFAALAAAAMTFASGEVLLLRRRRDDEFDVLPFAAVSLTSALLLTFSETLWAYSTAAEVYTLNTALLLTIAGCMLLWRRRRATRWMYIAAGVFGLALGVHHVTIGLSLVAIAYLVVRTAGWRFFMTKQFGIAAAVAVAAVLLIYAYEPLAAMRHPFLNWGDPENWRNLVDHVTGKQYRQYMSLSKAGTQLAFAAKLAATNFGPAWFPLAALLAVFGLVRSFRRERVLFGFVILLAAANVVWVVIYPIANDRDAYLLPALVAIVLAFTLGAHELVASAKDRRIRRATAIALLAVPVVAAAAGYAAHDRSRDWIAEDLFDNAMRPIEPGGILLTDNYQICSPAWYFQGVEKRRPDVTVIELALLNRGWYLDALASHHPAVVANVPAELEAIRPLVTAFNTLPFAKWSMMDDEQRALKAEINRMLVRIVETAATPVYATREVAIAQDSYIAPMRSELAKSFAFVPKGVVLEYVRANPPAAPQVPLVTRGLADGTIRYRSTDVIATEIVPFYREAYANQARYLAINRDFPGALAAYDKAIALGPPDASMARERSAIAANVR